MGAREDLERLRQELAQFVDVEGNPNSKPAGREVLQAESSLQGAMDQLIRLLGSRPEEEPGNWTVSKKAKPDTRTEHDRSPDCEPLLLVDRVHLEAPHGGKTQQTAGGAIEQGQDRELIQRTPRFFLLKWVVAATAVGIALFVPESGGLFLSVPTQPDTPAIFTAVIPLPAAEPLPAPKSQASAEGLSVAAGPVNPTAGAGGLGEALSLSAVPMRSTTTVPTPLEPPKTSEVVAEVARAKTKAAPDTQNNEDKSNPLASELLERGDARFATADLAGARLLYERAATGGNAYGALRLGQTYDPAFLAQTRLKGVRGDPSIAAYWYMRADQLGAAEAAALLRALATDLGLPAARH